MKNSDGFKATQRRVDAEEYDRLKRCIEPFLQENLKPGRLRHTYGVAETAVRLAERYGEDSRRAELAGLFHDMYRSASPEETNRLIELYELPKRFIGEPNLAHGMLAAEAMRRIYAVTDEELLRAVAYHTTGRAGMTKFEKIVYLADAIEPGRDYPCVDELRSLAEKDLNKACIACMERSMEYVRSCGGVLDENTESALRCLKEEEGSKGND